MKILLVTFSPSWGESFSRQLVGHEVRIVSHDEAILAFLDFEPEATLVGECENAKNINEKWGKAVLAFQDLRAMAQPGQKVLCCGFLPQKGEDFLRLPFSSEEFLERIYSLSDPK